MVWLPLALALCTKSAVSPSDRPPVEHWLGQKGWVIGHSAMGWATGLALLGLNRRGRHKNQGAPITADPGTIHADPWEIRADPGAIKTDPGAVIYRPWIGLDRPWKDPTSPVGGLVV